MSNWENQDNWEEQLHSFMEDVLGELDDMDDECKLFLTDLAAKVKNDKLSIHAALERYKEHALEHHFGGWVAADAESIKMEIEGNGLIDVSEGFKTNMLIAGEPGLADAIVRVVVHPGIIHGFDVVHASFGDVAMAVESKPWFEIARLNPRERQAVQWAATAAAKAMVSAS